MSVLDRPMEVREPEPEKGRRRFIAIAIVIAMVLAGIAIWATNDGETSASEQEIQELFDDYLVAWEVKDEATIRSLVTESFVINEYIYGVGETQGLALLLHVNDDIEGVIAMGFSNDWTTEQVGDRLVTGEGPWFVSVEENWSDSSADLEGQANYTLVEVDGELRIANHYWAGLSTPSS